MTFDRFNEGPPELDRQRPEEREREDDNKLPKYRDHGDEIEDALRWRNEQLGRVQTGFDGKNAVAGQPDALAGHSCATRKVDFEELAANRAAKLMELATKNHRLELALRDASEKLHAAANWETDAMRRLDLQLDAQMAQRVADENQII